MAEFSPMIIAQAAFAALVATIMTNVIVRRWAARPRRVRSQTPAPVAARPVLSIAQSKALIVQDADSPDARSVGPDGRSVRAPRARQLMQHAKILDQFMAWMIDEDYSGWYTPAQIYEAFQEFAWEKRLEEIDYRAFLAYLVVQPGVIKKRAYVKRNETFRHLRAATNGQERAVVYRIPTRQELAAIRHRRALVEAEAGRGRQVAGQRKVRLTPGLPQQAREQLRTAATQSNGWNLNDFDEDALGLSAAA